MRNKDASNNAKGAISNNDNENIPEKNAKGARKQGGQSKRKWKRYTYGYSRYNRNSQS